MNPARNISPTVSVLLQRCRNFVLSRASTRDYRNALDERQINRGVQYVHTFSRRWSSVKLEGHAGKDEAATTAIGESLRLQENLHPGTRCKLGFIAVDWLERDRRVRVSRLGLCVDVSSCSERNPQKDRSHFRLDDLDSALLAISVWRLRRWESAYLGGFDQLSRDDPINYQ